MATDAVKANPDSLLAKLAGDDVNGKTVFAAIEQGCPVANEVLDKYLGYLSIGIKNIINVFSPDTVVISGGLSEAGEAMSAPLEKKLNTNGMIKLSRLGNDAGIIGAALLCRV